MKTYEINFDAVTTMGGVVGNLTLKINLPNEECLSIKEMAFHRLCVEYARVCGVACSYADIKSVKEENRI